MIHITESQIEQTNSFLELVAELNKGFQSSIKTPMRHHHDFANPTADQDSTLLLMPSWQEGEKLGVKIVTISPNNQAQNLPTIQGLYVLFDAANGVPRALIDARSLTVKRTAAASALAASYLAKKEANSLLMVGTGALAPNLILAHISQQPIEKVWVWGRNKAKAQAIVDQLSDLDIDIKAVVDLDQHIPLADIISCATLSPTPLIKGKLLRPGQHIDLVGSYRKDTREADDDVIRCGTLFVDTFQGGLKESGDIVIPMASGLITKEDIKADLYALTRKEHPGRETDKEITVFKSVGHASEDLIAANYYYQKIVDSAI